MSKVYDLKTGKVIFTQAPRTYPSPEEKLIVEIAKVEMAKAGVSYVRKYSTRLVSNTNQRSHKFYCVRNYAKTNILEILNKEISKINSNYVAILTRSPWSDIPSIKIRPIVKY